MPDSPKPSSRSPLHTLDPGTKRDALKTDPSYYEGEEHCFPTRFLVMEHEAMQQITMLYFLSDSPKPFQISPSYYPDLDTKHDTHSNGVCSVHNLSRLKLQPQPSPVDEG